jgi:orotate phosphoribosyltransferase
LLIGLDIEGTILASKIAFNLQRSFSYVIPAKSVENNSEHDINFELNNGDKVILITDVVSTWETIKSVKEIYKIEDEQIAAIYTVFYRLSSYKSIEYNELISKTYSLNNSFDIEIVEKKMCKYKNSNICYAINK